jgi:hypothetical protein
MAGRSSAPLPNLAGSPLNSLKKEWKWESGIVWATFGRGRYGWPDRRIWSISADIAFKGRDDGRSKREIPTHHLELGIFQNGDGSTDDVEVPSS